MAKVTVKFIVKSNSPKVYLVGSTANLGEWNPSKAVEVKDGALSKQFEAGDTVCFKALSAKNWDAVEKGAYGEEVENRCFVAAKGLVVEVEVNNFAK